MNSYLPEKTDEYPAFADMPLVEEWGTCEEALRDLVAGANWESLMAELTGTITYVDGQSGAGGTGGGSTGGTGGDGGSDTQPSAGAPGADELAKTGDPAAWAALAAAVGVMATVGGVRLRRRNG